MSKPRIKVVWSHVHTHMDCRKKPAVVSLDCGVCGRSVTVEAHRCERTMARFERRHAHEDVPLRYRGDLSSAKGTEATLRYLTGFLMDNPKHRLTADELRGLGLLREWRVTVERQRKAEKEARA